MFDLSETDLRGRILGCGDGPASFNAELTALGKSQRIVSVDPLYQFTGPEIASRVEHTHETIISQVKLNPARYVWTYSTDPDALGVARLRAMQIFLGDYEAGRAAGRYLVAALPKLPFKDHEFDRHAKTREQFLRCGRRANSHHTGCDACSRNAEHACAGHEAEALRGFLVRQQQGRGAIVDA